MSLRFGTLAPAVVIAAALTVACEGDYSDRIISVDATGELVVVLYRDDNLSGNLNTQVDPPIINGRVRVARTAIAIDSIGRSTDSSGVARFTQIPVGRYQVDIGPSVMGDSLVRVNASQSFTVETADTTVVLVGIRYPTYSVSEARALPLGKKVWVRGIVLNFVGIYGDSTFHMTDTLTSIRMSRMRVPALAPGDSVQILGTRALRDGQPTFNVTSFLIRGTTDPLPPINVSSANARSAGGGTLDAAFVRVLLATVNDTVNTPEGRLIRVSDGSGPLSVLLSNTINFGNPTQFNPGTRMDVAGLLVPDALNPGTWALKPRARADIVIRP